MPAYYNEHDPQAAAWLRELIRDGHIAHGEVDERDIRQVQAHELRGFRQVHFFAGIGGWSLALRLAGWPDDRPAWTGSCPCPPFSSAGKKKLCPACGGKPIPHPLKTGVFACVPCGHEWVADERHLWPELRRIVADARPAVVFGEQVAGADGLIWLAGVRATLEALGYAVGAADLCAAGVGSPHIRQRLFWVADAGGERHDGEHAQLRGTGAGGRVEAHHPQASGGGEVGGVADAAGRGGSSRRDGAGRAGDGRPELPAGGLGSTGGLADGKARRRGEVDSHGGRGNEGSRAQGRERPSDGGRSVGLVHPVVPRLEGHAGHGDHGHEPGRLGAHTPGPTPAAGDAGWLDARWHLCRDGKHRRVPLEPAFFPLADGLPGRVGLLRGAGNAIVPAVAAAFIEAFAEGLTHRD